MAIGPGEGAVPDVHGPLVPPCSRDGDDEDELSDTIVDAYSVVGDDGPFWVLTPKPGRTGAASSSTVQSAAKTAGMNAATPLTVSPDWNGIRLRAFGKGR